MQRRSSRCCALLEGRAVSPSDFPEKVMLTEYNRGGMLISVSDPDAPRFVGRQVQPYFSASLVEELVGALERIEQTDWSQPPGEMPEEMARPALEKFKAQSSLEVKG